MNPLNNIQRSLGSLNSIMGAIGGIIGVIIVILGLVFGVGAAGQNEEGSSIGSSANEQPPIVDPIDVDPGELSPLPGPTESEDPTVEPEPEPTETEEPEPTETEEPVEPSDPSDPYDPGESETEDPVVSPTTELPEPSVDLPTAPEITVIELGKAFVVGGVDATNTFTLPVVLELQSGDVVSTSADIQLGLDTDARLLTVTTTVDTRPGTYLFTIDRDGQVIGQGAIVVSEPERTEREVVQLGNLELYPTKWTAWNLPADFDYGSTQEVYVLDQATQQPVSGVRGGVYNYQVQVAAEQGAAFGAYLVVVAIDGEPAAYGTVNVTPEPLYLPTAEVRVGSSFGLDLGPSVLVNSTSVAGVYYAGTDTPVQNVSVWYDNSSRQLKVTALENAQPGSYDFYLYTGNYFIGKGVIQVIKPAVAQEIDWNALREGRLGAMWMPAPEVTLFDRPNYAGGDFGPSWEPQAATVMRDLGFLTPGAEYFTPGGMCSAGFFITIQNRPYMLTAAHCGKAGDPVTINTVWGYQQVGVFVPEAHFLKEANPDENFDPLYDFALVELNNLGANLVHPAIGAQFELAGFIDSHSLRNQDVVCRIGRTQGYSCGRYIEHLNAEIFTVSNYLDEGDSGGPLFAYIGGKYYAVGVTSLKYNYHNIGGAQRVWGPIKYFGATLYGSLRL